MTVRVRRLGAFDRELARHTFAMMGDVFEEVWQPLADDHLDALLTKPEIWVYAALDVLDVDEPVGGLVAHQLTMTRAATSELLIYDLAVRLDRQRRGVGRALLRHVIADGATAGIAEMWVPADNDDEHALEFYRRTGGAAQATTIFTYPTASAH